MTKLEFGEAGSGCHSCKFWTYDMGDLGWCDFNSAENDVVTEGNFICPEWKRKEATCKT